MKRVSALIFIFVALLSLLIGCSPEAGSGAMPTNRPSTESSSSTAVTSITAPTETPQSAPEELPQGAETPEVASDETPPPPATLEASEPNEESAANVIQMATSETEILPAASQIEVPGNRILAMAFAKNENWVAVAGPEGLALFDATTFLPVDSFKNPADMRESFCLSFSPDESMLASAPRRTLITNASTGAPLYELDGPSRGDCFLWIPNTDRILLPSSGLKEYGPDGTLREYQSTGLNLGHLTVAGDGSLLAGVELFEDFIVTWSTATGEALSIQSPGSLDYLWIGQIALSPDGSFLAVMESKKISVLRTSDWQVVNVLDDLDQGAWLGSGAIPWFYQIDFSPNGHKLAVGSKGHLLLWDWQKDVVEDLVFLTHDGSKPVGSWDDPNSNNYGEILAIDWFSDGEQIIAASHKGLAIWDIHDSTVRLVEVVNFTAYQ